MHYLILELSLNQVTKADNAETCLLYNNIPTIQTSHPTTEYTPGRLSID